MEKFKNLFFLSIGIGIILSSCTKNEDIQTQNLVSKKDKSEKSYQKSLSIENPNNPYDYVGEKHNEILDFIADNHLDDLNETDFCNIVSAVKSEYNDTEEYTCSSVLQSAVSGMDSIYDNNNNYDSSFFYSMYTTGDISYEAYTIINTTAKEMSLLSDLSDKINYIKSIEDVVSTNTTLSSSELTSIQTSLAIYKYSSYYWDSQGNRDNFNVQLSVVAIGMDANAYWYVMNCDCPKGAFEDGGDIAAFTGLVSAAYDAIS